MHQMRHIGNRLQCNHGPVKSAAAGRRTRQKLFGAALFTFFLVFALVLVAARLLKHFGNFGLERNRHE